MPLSIKLKKFTTASDVPTTSELADGETAINTTDKKIYTRVGSSIIEVANIESRTVSFGGVELSLGGSDSTPAFDLSDGTNYPTSSLSGTITNAQLAGSIANAKLANSSINFGGVTLALGASDTTPAFNLSDATDYPTSSLTGTITNAQLAGSIANSKLSNSGFTLVDDSSTSTTISLGETLKIQGTSNEVDTSVSGDTLTVGLPNNVTIAGNLTVNGTTTTIDTTNTTVKDSLLELNSGASSNSNDSGLIIERGSTGNNAIFMWDESEDEFIVGTTTATADSTGNITHSKADFEAAKITGTQFELANTTTNDSLLITTTEDSSTAGPVVSLKRNSSSPADADYLGQIKFKGENDNDQEVNYAKITGKIDDASDGNERGLIEIAMITGGSQEIVARFKHDGLFLNTGNTLRFEGDGADAHELTLKAADSLDADRTATLPNATGTIALEGTVTSGSTSITSNLGSRTFETESLDTPVGFITISIGGTNYKLPYYSVWL